MSSQTPSTYPAPPSAPHGGAMDPNEFRLRQARAQQSSTSSTPSAVIPGAAATEDPPHGGAMDPHEVRLRLARLQQTSGPSSPALSSPQPNNALAARGGVPIQRPDLQPAHYGSSSHLVNSPSSPPSGYSMSQSVQSPQSAYSGQYFPTQMGHQPSNPIQAQQPPQSPYSSMPDQVSR